MDKSSARLKNGQSSRWLPGLAVRMLFHSVDFVEYDRAKAVISRPFHFANRRADILQRNQSRAEDSLRELIHQSQQ